MMPNNLEYLLHYATANKNDTILEYVNTTLTRMAYGGIFDPIDGGFSRYAVDVKWHVPHFEKMLYDNGQLISLYSKAYAVTKNSLYKETVEKSVGFATLELLDNNGGFYSSLDADSKNSSGKLEEGAYYVWTEKELDSILGSESSVFKTYYNINSYGYWEEDKYVLIRDTSDNEIADSLGIATTNLTQQIAKNLKQLKKVRDQREKPRLDDKILTSWNGLMLKGLTDAYRYLQNDKYLQLALKNANFLEQEIIQDDFSVYRNHKNGKSSINGFLDDYATLIDSFIGLYEVTFDDRWLTLAKNLTDYAITHFKDQESNMFYYTSDLDDKLIRRSIETNDNVISASNSIMANNLYKLHKVYMKEPYGEIASAMINNVQDNFIKSAQGFSNWMHLISYQQNNFYEIAIVGEAYKEIGRELGKEYIPNSILVATKDDQSPIELLQNRHVPDQTLIYVCIEGSCKLPVATPEKVLKQL